MLGDVSHVASCGQLRGRARTFHSSTCLLLTTLASMSLSALATHTETDFIAVATAFSSCSLRARNNQEEIGHTEPGHDDGRDRAGGAGPHGFTPSICFTALLLNWLLARNSSIRLS